jgi:F-type H+-transporting ATPase subunit b
VKRLLNTALLAAQLFAAPAFAAEPATGQAAAEHVASSEGAAGTDHEEHHLDPRSLGLQFFNFAVLLFILIKFGGGAINKSLRARHDQLKIDLEESQKVRAAAEARAKQQEQRLANLEQELTAMRAAIRQDAENEKARLIKSAEERARAIQEETRFQLDQQVKDAEQRFRAEVAQAAVKVAEELLRRSVTPSDEQRLNQSFVSELGSRAEAPKGPTRTQPQETLG